MLPADEAHVSPEMGTKMAVEFDDRRPSEAVVSAIAAHTGVDPLELTPLYHTVEPDALDSLIDHARTSDAAASSQWFSFQYEGYRVLVCAGGRVFLEPLE